MAYDGEVKFKTSIDNSGLQKDAKQAQGILEGLTKKLSSSKMANIGASVSGIGVAVKAASTAMKAAAATVKDLTDTYKTQAQAETQLETAAKNNPYLNESSVRQLKKYAGELQSISTAGDEQLIPMMAQLAAAGRTQTEIQQIMSAALDASASGAISLESAVQGLNMSYSGQIGMLGRQLPMLKNLTEEELRQGKAVAVIAKQYKGMAKETAAATGSSEQLKNTWGDFKEIVGRGLNRAIAPIESAVTKVISKINDAITRARSLEEDAEAMKNDAVKGTDYDETTVDERIKSAEQARKEELEAAKAAEREKAVARKAAVEIAKAEANTVLAELYDLEQHADETYREYEERMKRVRREWNEIANDFRGVTIDPTLNPEFASGEITYDEARAREYEKAIRLVAEARGEDEDTLRRILTVEGILDETTGGMVKTVEEFNEELERGLETAEAMNRESERNAEEAAAMNAASEAKRAYSEAIAAKEREIALRRKTGEEITAEREAQELYTTKVSAFMKLAEGFKDVNNIYIDGRNVLGEIAEEAERLKSAESTLEKIEELAGGLAKEAEELIDTGAQGEGTLAGSIQSAIDALREQKDLFGDNADAAEKFEGKIKDLERLLPGVKIAELKISIDEENALSRLQELNERKAALERQWSESEVEREQMTADEKIRIQEDYAKAVESLNRQIREAEEEENRLRLESAASVVSQIQSSISDIASAMKDASDLMLQTVQSQTDAELATLEEKYLKGEMSEEEYNEAVLEAKKKEAQEEYKIQMFQWSASILQATANIAQGVTQAIAQGGVAGIITGAIVGAAGAVQLASIIAAKPQAPSFATGGIVPGSSYSGDKVLANVNSGEMILNAAQQKSLWEAANGRGAGGGANIVINNSASNIATAQPRLTRDAIEIMIDARVNESMKSGRYNQSLNMAQQGMSGDFYGI